MNFLAHLFFAEDTPESRIGNLAGDFVKGLLHDRFAPAIAAGIMEHRKLDAFTDTHPEIASVRRILSPESGHYSRVVGDMFIDHFLARDFARYDGRGLPQFLEHVWSQIDPRVDDLPGRLRYVYPRMRDEGWLLSYREVAGIRTALYNMSFRIARRPALADSVHLLEDARDELSHHVHAFLADAIAYSLRLRA
jgi:acyl carrier protein phosphodiesterase